MTLSVSKRRSRAANTGDNVIPSSLRGVSSKRSSRAPLAFGYALLAALASGAAQAQAPVAEGPSVLPVVLTFVLVLALIPVAVWMLKRMGAGNVSGSAGLRVVAQLSLGQRERLVVVEAGDRWLLLGVTAAAINRVGTLPKGELPIAPTPVASFASLLMNARKGRGHD